ncbi:MAG: mannose-1-phosphate guanylyltransferase/mannose-6-phosphate isomerase [Desulfobacteraceae bacterium 4572_88]|nr:MAG: mannose-1-phosphate guanylyltransferase/mannose-6-phosphate isomerase [Desulfobacteraceae bacterium 4572_88]
MPDHKINAYSLLLAGGTGTRLWPVSRELYPKQLVSFIGRDSLVQSTIKRLSPTLDAENVRIVCGTEHFHEIARHMAEVGGFSEGQIICEPSGRNTAPAILLGILTLLQETSDAVVCVFPADHVIRDIENFQEQLMSAIRLAEMGHIVTFGIRPNYPETGYGYIEGGDEIADGALSLRRFVEKPDKETAAAYLDAGNFFWNSGMFAFKTSVILEEFEAFQPALLEKMRAILSQGEKISKKGYGQLPNISIDYAIMENTQKGVILPSDFGWSDIGSWKSLYDFLPKDENNNVIDGDVIAKDTENCFIMGRKRLIATNHIRNMVVIGTPDSVFVSDLESSRDVKSIVEQLREKGRKEYHKHRTVHHSWGSYTLLKQKEDFEVARLIIYPGATLELENNTTAVSRVVIIKGTGKIVKDKQTRILKKGQSTVISFESQDASLPVKLKNTEEEALHLIQIKMNWAM